MKDIDIIANQILDIKKRVPIFLEHQQGNDKGFYRYSYSGDIPRGENWGIGTTALALKILYTIGVGHKDKRVINAIDRLKDWISDDGYIFDPIVVRRRLINSVMKSIRNRDLRCVENLKYKKAESRQCHSAMMLYGELPSSIPRSVENDLNNVDRFVAGLDWRNPWDAGSHLSHLLFYSKLALEINLIGSEQYDSIIKIVLDQLGVIQKKCDGSWYMGTPPNQWKINGAMKVITGLYAIGYTDITHHRELIDLCLANVNNNQACDNFNIVYVLHKASLMEPTYRYGEIVEFAKKRFGVYMTYYHPKEGGFSFYTNKSNTNYYGARISKGYNEPDVHGTALFMWGMSIISQIIGISDVVGLREFRA